MIFKKDRYDKLNFNSFSTEEIMSIINEGELLKKVAQVALTKTIHDAVNSKRDGKIARHMLGVIEDMVEGFKGIKTRKDIDDIRKKELGLEIYKQS